MKVPVGAVGYLGLTQYEAEARVQPSVQTAFEEMSIAAEPPGLLEQANSPWMSLTQAPGPHTGSPYRSKVMAPFEGEHTTAPYLSLTQEASGGGQSIRPLMSAMH
jgi:hypothetical protein